MLKKIESYRIENSTTGVNCVTASGKEIWCPLYKTDFESVYSALIDIINVAIEACRESGCDDIVITTFETEDGMAGMCSCGSDEIFPKDSRIVISREATTKKI